jgi:hypothetical protein
VISFDHLSVDQRAEIAAQLRPAAAAASGLVGAALAAIADAFDRGGHVSVDVSVLDTSGGVQLAVVFVDVLTACHTRWAQALPASERGPYLAIGLERIARQFGTTPPDPRLN